MKKPRISAFWSKKSDPSDRVHLRLAISIPILLVLFILGYGVISFELFSRKWAEFERVGAELIAAELLRGHLISMLLLSVVAVVAGITLAYTILRPVRIVEETAKKISQGNLSQRAPTLAMAGELGALSRSFNGMIDFLNQSIEQRDRFILQGVENGLLTVSLDGAITGLNAKGAEILGLESSVAIGQRVSDLRRGRSLSHQPFWERVAALLTMDLGDIQHWDDDSLLDSGAEQLGLLISTSVMRGPKGRPTGLMINFRDPAETDNLNAQLSKTDQLAAMGTFTMGLAHELRNPLGSIKGLAQLLDMELGESEEAKDIIARIVREVDRVDAFVRELNDYSSQSGETVSAVDINGLLHQSLESVRDQYAGDPGKQFEIVEDYGAASTVRCEPQRIVQAFLNILRNAYEEAPSGSRLELKSRSRTEGDKSFVDVSIRNTGSTIKGEHWDHIFDPFFSTKKTGSGLGLAIVYQILTQNGATVDFTSGPDDVTFEIVFDAAQHTAVAGEEKNILSAAGPFAETG